MHLAIETTLREEWPAESSVNIKQHNELPSRFHAILSQHYTRLLSSWFSANSSSYR
jgi:hypothetical protein